MAIPGILVGTPPDVGGRITMTVNPPLNRAIEILAQKNRLKQINIRSANLNYFSFSRQLAKIAHVFVCAELGIGFFRPLLLPQILGEDVMPTYFVGGFDPPLPQSRESLLLREVKAQDQSFFVVDISLHALPHLPRYQVVAGRQCEA
jgi:hypothetical protein